MSYPKDDKGKAERRKLPSWTNPDEGENKPHRKRQFDSAGQDKAQTCKESESQQSTHSHALHFSQLLEGVIFVLSGFVNPERSTLRSQALEMGAEYRPDWTSECTLLICAFPDTPKFRQVKADCGTIVSKDWIAECYKKKKLVEIDRYLMHAGKPWRKNNDVPLCNQDQGNKKSAKVSKKLEGRPLHMMDDSSISESGVRESIIKHFPPCKLKEWATIDLTATVSWLEKQEERPEPDEIKKIAAEGIITCLQDAIEALDHNQDIKSVTEQWMFIPCVVKELAKLDCGTRKGLLTKEELSKLALDCKHVYEVEFNRLDDYPIKGKEPKGAGDNYSDLERKAVLDTEGFDSDSTIEMTEEEIDLAYRGFLRS